MKTTKKIMSMITKQADLFLLFFALLSFFILIVVKTDYYKYLFIVKFSPPIAWVLGALVAILIEGTRFSLMISSAEDVRRGNNWRAFLGGIISVSLLGYEIYLCSEVGFYWSSTNFVYQNIFQFIAALGMVLEIRLCLLMSNEEAPHAAENQTTQDEKPQKTTPSTNGQHKEKVLF